MKKMTTLPKKVTILAACVFVILLLSSSVLSAKFSFESGNLIKIENQPFELQCIVTGTEAELKDLKSTWKRPNPNADSGEIPIVEEDGSASITEEKSDGVFTSTLRVPGPPNVGTVRYYQCAVEPGGHQNNFPIHVLRARAVPKIVPVYPIESKAKTLKEKVVLNCSVSYENQNHNADYNLNLSWIKDGKVLNETNYKYKVGNYTETCQHTLDIKNFRDGGNYVCRWVLRLSGKPSFITGNTTEVLSISAYRVGPTEKEVKDVAGSDVKLTCDVGGYPIKFEWLDEQGAVIVGDSRIRPVANVLYIDDIDYEDRKKYTCEGTVGNETLKQIITLRVKDPLAPLWPFLGILAEAIVVFLIILASECYKKRNQNETDGAVPKTETTDQPSTSQT